MFSTYLSLHNSKPSNLDFDLKKINPKVLKIKPDHNRYEFANSHIYVTF
jgi:hypothetical protein